MTFQFTHCRGFDLFLRKKIRKKGRHKLTPHVAGLVISCNYFTLHLIRICSYLSSGFRIPLHRHFLYTWGQTENWNTPRLTGISSQTTFEKGSTCPNRKAGQQPLAPHRKKPQRKRKMYQLKQFYKLLFFIVQCPLKLIPRPLIAGAISQHSWSHRTILTSLVEMWLKPPGAHS